MMDRGVSALRLQIWPFRSLSHFGMVVSKHLGELMFN